jgi:hypothetical protein
MRQFAHWISDAGKPEAAFNILVPQTIFLNRYTVNTVLAKYLGYIDQYIIIAFLLAAIHWRYDRIIVADHSNSPTILLTPGRKCVVMVHDTIAIRQSKGLIGAAPRVGLSGRILQSIILFSLKRARSLWVNPGPVKRELKALGVPAATTEIGCAMDMERFAKPATAIPAGDSDRGYVLNVAGDGWRKRKMDLVNIWESLAEGPKLLLVGKTGEPVYSEIHKRGLSGRIIVFNDVSDGELRWLYENCAAAITASHEEGFCIPVLEGFYFRKLVMTPASATIYSELFGTAVTPLEMSDPKRAAAQLMASIGQERPPGQTIEQDKLLSHWSMENFRERVRRELFPH